MSESGSEFFSAFATEPVDLSHGRHPAPHVPSTETKARYSSPTGTELEIYWSMWSFSLHVSTFVPFSQSRKSHIWQYFRGSTELADVFTLSLGLHAARLGEPAGMRTSVHFCGVAHVSPRFRRQISCISFTTGCFLPTAVAVAEFATPNSNYLSFISVIDSYSKFPHLARKFLYVLVYRVDNVTDLPLEVMIVIFDCVYKEAGEVSYGQIKKLRCYCFRANHIFP